MYLVTGGAGVLGRIVGEHLVTRWNAKVVLAGRAASVQHLFPGTVYVQADITDAASVQSLVASVKSRCGRIDGVFHAAGVLRDGRVAYKSVVDAEAVLAPKVVGTRLLDEATKTEPLDCFVLFSSVAAAIGSAGQTDYAYANGFMDGFAEWREEQRTGGVRAGRTI